MPEPLVATNLKTLKRLYVGKVRDTYLLDQVPRGYEKSHEDEKILLSVATDRISSNDRIMPTPIPDKGRILTQMTLHWLKLFGDLLPNHLITADVNEYPEQCQPYAELLEGRSMLVKQLKMFPAEAIVRGYLAGSGWKSYQKDGTVCGILLRPGLKEAEQLPEPVFTPSNKAAAGQHDENITYQQLVDLIGEYYAGLIKDFSLMLYRKAERYAAARGIRLADTKFEFGVDTNGALHLADEVLTPDSSRFWPDDRYEIGTSPESFDKQYLRDYLVSIGWNPSMLAPRLPEEVVENTRRRYIEALEYLTGKTFQSAATVQMMN